MYDLFLGSLFAKANVPTCEAETAVNLSIYSRCIMSDLTTSAVKWSEFLATERRCIVLPVRYELNLYVI
jgi:hypothetical protein